LLGQVIKNNPVMLARVPERRELTRPKALKL
jgi:hypothetical protein